MRKAYKLPFFALTIFCSIFFVSNRAFAFDPVCACYFGAENDCEIIEIEDVWTVASDDNAIEKADCEKKCTDAHTGETVKAIYESPKDGVIISATKNACELAHKLVVEKHNPKTNAVIPKLNVPIPGVTFSPIAMVGNELSVNFLGEYLQGIYRYLIAISTTIAIVFLMVGGFQYVIGAGMQEQVSKGKKRIGNALIGLILLLSTSFILSTINPQLAALNPLRVKFVEESEFAVEIEFDEADAEGAEDAYTSADAKSGRFFDGGAVCIGKACVEWCNSNKDPSLWPLSNKKTIDPALTSKIPKTTGIRKSRNDIFATKEVQAALKRAGEIAVAKNPNYYILVTDGFRPLLRQIKYVCERVASGKENLINGIGTMVANPGDSPHGMGIALDIQLFEGKTQVTTSGSGAEQKKEKWRVGAGILADIMAEAGFVRYSKEIWHFNLESKLPKGKGCLCKGAAECPFPPSC